MNKIYKVIWSKTRNCYVAVAEFVKRQGKSSSGLNRRHIGAALGNKTAASLLAGKAVAAALLAASVVCGVPGMALANSGGTPDADGNYIGNAPDYAVVIDSDVRGKVYGCRESDLSALRASVMVKSGTVGIVGAGTFVYGGFSVSGYYVSSNMVTVSGGTVGVSGHGEMIGGRSMYRNAEDNTVTVSSGTLNVSVGGGYSGGEGDAKINTVIISGGTVQEVYGGRSESGSATGNEVTVSGGSVTGNVYGGNAFNGDATYNKVTLNGGAINADVYGGHVWEPTSTGKATDNTVVLDTGATGKTFNSNLYGGKTNGSGDDISGNSLQVKGKGIAVTSINNFENYNFVLPADSKAGDTMLQLTAQNAGLTIDGSKVGVSLANGTLADIGLGLDESVTLLHKTGGSGAFTVTNPQQLPKLEDKLDDVDSGFTTLVGKVRKPDREDKLDFTLTEKYLYGDGGVNATGQREIGNTLTIKSGKATAAFGGRSENWAVNNSVTMEGGELVVLADEENPNYSISGNLYGGYAGDLSSLGSDNATDNTVEISGGKVEGYVYGGYAEKGNATDNTVEISGGKVGRAVYGGYAENGNATGNTVVISGGMIAGEVSGMSEGSVYGGYAENGSATGNTVVLGEGLTGRTFDTLHLYGGNGGDDTSGNTLQVEGRNIKVMSIGRFKNYTVMLPQSVQAGDTILDSAQISGGHLILDGSRIRVFSGGRLGLNLGESVTVLKVRDVLESDDNHFNLINADQIPPLTERLDNEATGFVTLAGKIKPVIKNELNLTVTEKYLYGDGGTNTPGQRKADNTLTITGGKATAAFGGRATTNDVTGNKVEMTGGELVYDTLYADIQGSLYGGLTDKGNANHNTVTVSGGKLKERVYGGASYDGNTENNTVTIKGGTVGTHVYGGRTYGGGNAVNNTVTIEGGTVGKRVYGGRSDGGNAVNNTVTIKGGTVGERVYGGFSNGDDAERNTVNLTGTTHGLDGTQLYGYNDGAASHSGNELHIGGAKTYDKNGTATITKGSWQGMDANGKHTNRVDTVSNFDSIALHHVVWGDTPALAAKEIKNIGGLDVTGLEFFTHPDNSTVHEHAYKDYMVLVHADTNDLTGLKISYLDEGNVKTEALTNQGIHYRNTVHHSTENGVTVDGIEKKRIYLADHNKSVDFCFHVTGDKLTVGEVEFVKGGTARILDGRFDVRNAAIDTEGLTFTAASKLQMAAGDAMTLVDAEDAIAAKNGATLQPFATKQLTDAYSFTPAEGVTVAATLRGTLNATPKNNGLVYKVNSNQADKLTFSSVDWKDSGALFKRPAAVTFAGAAVDTSEIHFKNLKDLKGNAQMTLVSDFGGSPGRITGTTYKIGTTLEGEGAASLVNGDLIFTTKAGTKNHAQEQTHNTVMGMTAGLAALSGGTEQISQAMDILSLMDGFGGTTGSGSSGSTGNPGDNTTNGSGSSDSRESSGGGGAGQEENEREANGSIIASVGGGHMHQETGSHVTSNTWNGVLGIGGKRAVKSGTWQYAAFAEHGRANFTLHSDAGRGDGTSKYTGGGLLAKWQSRHDVYVEGSIRAGRMHDTASDMLYDAATGQSYGYDVHANYIGGHVGFGKVFRYNNGRSLDVYGKYFHMKRDGVSFEAEGHYDLDSVTSSVLRVGARYGATDKKWNWYGGLAYEYEFDGKATGRADGAEIRAASIKGGSVRGELGIRMEATKTSPWKADIRLTGYAGKRRGIGGNVSVAYTF